MSYPTATAAQPSQDDALVRRAQQGDEAAFDRLVELFAPRVYQLAYRLTNNPEDARDMAQEAFVRVYQALPRFKGDAAFSTWLYRIVTNLCYDELKRRRRRAPTFSETHDDDEFSPDELTSAAEGTEDALLRRERQQAVRRAITQLPEIFRLVLVLYDIQGHSYQEIADILRQNIGTVKSRLNRARHMLREALSAERELFETRDSRTV
jgi:RNA polymerase sigma-70 factor (ECF subfamily)